MPCPLQVAKTAQLLKTFISKTGTMHCGCLMVDKLAEKLSSLSAEEVQQVVTLTMESAARNFNGPVSDMCLNNVRFERGISEFYVLRMQKLGNEKLEE